VVVLQRSPPSPRASQKCDRVMGPPPPPPRWAGGGGGPVNRRMQDGEGNKRSLHNRVRGGGAVQDVQQHHLHKFYQQI